MVDGVEQFVLVSVFKIAFNCCHHLFDFSGFKLDAQEILEGGNIDRGCLRDGTHELFASLNATKVPVLVFSAGIGDTVSAILKHADLLMPTVHVINIIFQLVCVILNTNHLMYSHRLSRTSYAGRTAF